MEHVNELRGLIEQLQNQLRISEQRQTDLSNRIALVNNHLQQQNLQVAETEQVDEDVNTQLTSGDQIQLESYRTIPEFSGNKGQYRSWRNQVERRMKMIENFKTHPKYEAALGIIRSKITGPASDVLTNNKTAYNIDAIIRRLDSSYADQRPLYIVEAELTSIKQAGKTLQEFYDAINQGLNMVISKIVLSYNTLNEQKPLISEAQQKAIRTFILGLKSQAMRNILYSHKPKTLEEAFTTAQTIFYDNQYLQLDQNREVNFSKNTFASKNKQSQNFSPLNVKMNCNQQQRPIQTNNKPEVKAEDPSNRFKQTTNWQKPNQQPQRIQRINQLQDNESSPNEGDENNICEEIPDDLISNASQESNESNTASTFLSA